MEIQTTRRDLIVRRQERKVADTKRLLQDGCSITHLEIAPLLIACLVNPAWLEKGID